MENGKRSARPAKGSWDALFEEATDLAYREDDRAVAAYWRIIDRLSNLPKERRGPGSKLYSYLEPSLFNTQFFLALRGRFHDAAEFCLDRVADLLSPEALTDWQLNRAKLLGWQAKRGEATTLLNDLMAANPLETPICWALFEMHLDAGEMTLAETVLAQMADDLAGPPGQALPDEEQNEVLSLLAYFRSRLGMARQAYEDAFASFQQAAKLSPIYEENWHMLYRPLIQAGQYELANRALNREQSLASRHFWRGLLGHRQGDQVGSRLEWEAAIQVNSNDLLIRSLADWVLAHYYLGDPERVGLELILRLLRHPKAGPEPLLLLLAGLGWGLHAETANLQTNLRFARSRYRGALLSPTLPPEYWPIAQDLLPAPMLGEVKELFGG
jgi:tetratricopeptide (TPR) repeat protein